MGEYIQNFKRSEIKYILTEKNFSELMKIIPNYFEKDKFYKSNILNIYYDTPEFLLVRNSLEKPVYKEKLRLRSYGVPNKSSYVFPEIKKKFKGIVYKRRISAALYDAEKFLNGEIDTCYSENSQIESEIRYFLKVYKNIAPAMFLSYDRFSYISRDENKIRLTFDSNITYREYELSLSNGVYGKKLLPENTYIMELKIANSMPMQLSKILNDLEIYPASFSKYGSAYEREHNKVLNISDNILIRA